LGGGLHEQFLEASPTYDDDDDDDYNYAEIARVGTLSPSTEFAVQDSVHRIPW